MTRFTILFASFFICLVPLVANDDTRWIQRSNELSLPALEVLARYNPEAAGRYGLNGYDEAILDLRENVYERSRTDTLHVIADLEAKLSSESHTKVRQDLELLVQTLSDRVERNERSYQNLLPFINVAEIVFESTKALLNANTDPARYPAAVVRLKKYAGLAGDRTPITTLAKRRIAERLKVEGLLGPYRGNVEKAIRNAQRFLDGIADLMKTHEQDDWQEAHTSLKAQLESYGDWIREEVLPRARESYLLPREIYVDRLRSFGVRIGPEELIERGQFGYAETRTEMESLGKRIAAQRGWTEDSYRDVIRQLKQEQFAIEEILPFYEQRLVEIEDILRREKIVTLPKRKCRIRFATAAESARIAAPSMQPPRLIDNTGEYGSFLIPLRNPNAASGDKMDDFLHKSISWSLTAHEARPGHEMQFSAIIENGVSIPRAVFAWNSANVEGWGLYAESIVQEHLPVEGQFFTHYMKLLRAARSFLDPMLNVGQLTPQQAKSFLMRELLLSEPMAAQEIDRYTSWMPGQATSYYYGLMKLQTLRAQAELALGDRFDQLEYHDFILAQGLLPLELLDKAVLEEFVSREKQKPRTDSGKAAKPAKLPSHTPGDRELDSVRTALSEYISETLVDTGIPSLSIALVKDGSIAWQDAFGYSNATLKVPATPDTVYAVASCFKPVTAMAVMQLVDKGLVELDDPVNQYLGDSPLSDLTGDGKPVTVRHLLSHYSGLSVSTQLVPVWQRELPKTLQEHVAELQPVSDPGVKYEYSNSGFTVAGLLIEKVTGHSFEHYVVENILKPAGCSTLGPVNPTPEMLEHLARPYSVVDQKPIPEVNYRLDVVPAGDIHLTVPDLARILSPHVNDGLIGKTRLLSVSSIEEMRTPQFGGSDGLDFGIRKIDGETFVMHGGGIPGYSSKFLLATKSGDGVCIAANAGDQHLVVNTVACLAMDLLRGKGAGGELTQKIVHVGISFQEDKETGLLRIGAIFANSPASAAGLSAGMLISKINQVSVKGKSLSKCLDLMKGPKGTSLKFQFSKPLRGGKKTIVLTKQEFLAPT